MKLYGILGLTIGALMAIVALTLLPSTVSNEEMTTLPYTGAVIGSGKFVETYNLPRAQVREMVFNGGLAVFLAGAIFFVGGSIGERLRQPSHHAPSAADGDTPSIQTPPIPAALDIPFSNDEATRNKMILAAIMLPIIMLVLVFLAAQLRLS
ncbi:hypothetical protein [Sphingobium chungbukense]|uniref:Uncharacterized protein n=1 Tax=Sphingobium chungbukense TaxID=56193 RepID=A0A0M3APY5_9SPHN|nr:hypothetical protein [Sphingobium chungbukense]KKW92237.1 hypothetical protein YP76_09880 [Sphingobium chungbukense]